VDNEGIGGCVPQSGVSSSTAAPAAALPVAALPFAATPLVTPPAMPLARTLELPVLSTATEIHAAGATVVGVTEVLLGDATNSYGLPVGASSATTPGMKRKIKM